MKTLLLIITVVVMVCVVSAVATIGPLLSEWVTSYGVAP